MAEFKRKPRAFPDASRRSSWSPSSQVPGSIVRLLSQRSSLHVSESKPSAKIVPTRTVGSDTSRGLPVSPRSGLAKSRSFVLPRLSSFSRRRSLTVTRSMSDLHEMRITSANYDIIMDRFQLRRLTQVDIPPQRVILDPDVAAEAPPLAAPRTRRWLDDLLARLRQPIRPDSSLAFLHTLFAVTAFHLQVFYVPFVSIYYHQTTWGILRGHIAFEVVFLVDLLLQLNTAYRDDKNRLVTSRRSIISHYVRSWAVADLVSATPICMIQYLSDTSHTTVLVPTAWKLVGVGLRGAHIYSIYSCLFCAGVVRPGCERSFLSWLLYSRYAHLISIAKLIWLVVTTVHYLACTRHWLLVSDRSGMDIHEQSIWTSYFADFFYAICLLQGQGDGSSGESVPEYLFSILTVLLGSVLLAIVFGNVAMLVSNFNANVTNYQRKLESIVATMNKLHLPEPLRRRIHQYYSHLWSEYESLDGDISGFSRELSHQLALEVRLCKYMKLVVHVPFWRDCSSDFVTQIVLSLVVRVYLPNDYVIRQGEIGTELFMINRGICELIVDKDGSKVDLRTRPSQRPGTKAHYPAVSTGLSKRHMRRRGSHLLRHRNSRGGLELLPGEALGEMSLLMNYRHTANVLSTCALTHVEMCILTREAFQLLITRFADDRRVVLQRMIHACIERDGVPIPWQDMFAATGVDARGLSPSAAAQTLIEHIDREVVDETIKYGFQRGSCARDSTPPTCVRASTLRMDPDASSRQLRDVQQGQEAMRAMIHGLLDAVQSLKDESTRVSSLATTIRSVSVLDASKDSLSPPPSSQD